MEAVEFEVPAVPSPHRVLMLGAATNGWYEAEDDDRRERILPRFQTMMNEWRDLGARVLATLDDDLFMVRTAGRGELHVVPPPRGRQPRRAGCDDAACPCDGRRRAHGQVRALPGADRPPVLPTGIAAREPPAPSLRRARRSVPA